MARKKTQVEDMPILESIEEIEDFVEAYTIGGFDAYRDAYDDMNFDMDNYGYDY
jgi:hypothetical protein